MLLVTVSREQSSSGKVIDNGSRLVPNFKNNVLYSTYPEGVEPLEQSSKMYSIGTEGKKVAISRNRDFTHLGPYLYGENITDPKNGNGVFDRDGRSAHFYVYSTTATTGIIINANGSQWRSDAWSLDRYWCCEFSTSKLTQANAPLSIQLGAMHQHDVVGCPRYWAIEWSLDKKSWTRVKEYTVPDYIMLGTQKVWQFAGPKYVSATLPADADVWGKSKVYVRLIPISKAAGTRESYDGGSISSKYYSALNYFAVRYNK